MTMSLVSSSSKLLDFVFNFSSHGNIFVLVGTFSNIWGLKQSDIPTFGTALPGDFALKFKEILSEQLSKCYRYLGVNLLHPHPY